VSPAPEDADRLIRHPIRDLSRLELRHRALGSSELMADVAHPRGAPAEEARRVDLERHVSEREGDRLVADDRSPKLLAMHGVVERELIRGAGDADSLGSDGWTGELEGAQLR